MQSQRCWRGESGQCDGLGKGRGGGGASRGPFSRARGTKRSSGKSRFTRVRLGAPSAAQATKRRGHHATPEDPCLNLEQSGSSASSARRHRRGRVGHCRPPARSRDRLAGDQRHQRPLCGVHSRCRDRPQLREVRGRALCRGQPHELGKYHRDLPAGPVEQRWRPRLGGGRDAGRWRIVGDSPVAFQSVRDGNPRGPAVRTRLRSMGLVWARDSHKRHRSHRLRRLDLLQPEPGQERQYRRRSGLVRWRADLAARPEPPLGRCHGRAAARPRQQLPVLSRQRVSDRESVTADPTRPGYAYAVWDVLIGPNMSVEADLHAVAFTDFTLFSRTTDFGLTWEAAKVINTSAHPSGQNNQTIGNMIVVDPRNGTLYNFFDQIFNTGSNAGGNPGGAHRFNVAFQKSTDAGDTWSPAQIIASLQSIGVADPNNVDPRTNEPPAPLRTGDILPMPAIDAATGDLYVVWQDARFSGHDEIVISTSGDGGATWTAPKRVSTPTGQPAFTAAVAVSSTGSVGVTYYQLDATSLGSIPTNYFIKEFARSAVTSSNPSSIDSGAGATPVASPFNMLDAPFAVGYFTGDYEALVTTDGGFVPIFVQGACGESLSCRALASVTPPADRNPTGNDSTDVFIATGF